MSYKRIAIVGTLNTGKSTLASKLAEALHIPLAERVKSGDRFKQFFSYMDLDKLTTMQIMKIATILYFDRLVSEIKPEFVSDGGSLTDLARAYALVSNYKIPSFVISIYEKAHEVLAKCYTHIFYLPIEDHIPFKPEILKYLDLRGDIDKSLKKLLKDNHFNYTQLTGTVDDRVSQTIKLLH